MKLEITEPREATVAEVFSCPLQLSGFIGLGRTLRWGSFRQRYACQSIRISPLSARACPWSTSDNLDGYFELQP